MRAAFRLLVMICLLWCATGVAEPGEAHGDVGGGHRATAGAHLDAASDHEAPDDGPAHGGGGAHHHHCPVAPDLARLGVAGRIVGPGRVPVAPVVVPLASLTRAPPLQPPSAA